MNNLKPKVRIDKFTGSGDGLLYYNEGFTAGNENGNSLLTETYKFEKYFNSYDSNFQGETDGHSEFKTMIPLKVIQGGSLYHIAVDGFGQLFLKGGNLYEGFLQQIVGLGNYPDIFELPSGNILLAGSSSNSSYAHILIRGYCHADSTTSKIVDGAGRNLSTLGAGGMSVQNLNTGAIYSITSITDENATKDALNFTAQAGKANSEGDEFIVLVQNKFTLTADRYMRRQIKQSGDKYYILNGNMLARLDGDESTFKQDFKLFPAGFSSLAFDVNSGKQLFSAKNETGKSILLLWDEFSDGWNNIIDLDGDVYSIKSYKSGWVFVLKGIIYYTDGFSIQELSSYSDTVKIGQATINFLSPTHFNGISVFNNIIYFINENASNAYDGMRTNYGVYSFDPKNGWSYLAGFLNEKQIVIPTFITLSNENIYVGFWGKDEVLDEYQSGISIIKEGSNTVTKLNKSFMTYVELKENTQIFGVGLNIGFNNDIRRSGLSAEKKTSIEVSIGDGNQELIKGFAGDIVSSTVIDVTKSYDVVNIGDELRVVSPYSRNSGNRTWVTNKQTLTSAIRLTVSPALTSGESTVTPTINIIKVKKCDKKTITENQMNTEQMFFLTTPIYSNKIFIEVTVYGIANSMPISITGINIY